MLNLVNTTLQYKKRSSGINYCMTSNSCYI